MGNLLLQLPRVLLRLLENRFQDLTGILGADVDDVVGVVLEFSPILLGGLG